MVLVSEGPDAAVKDAVALAGACAFGTEPFVPTSARAAAPDQSTPAVTLTTLERAGFGAATAMASAAGRAYCWHCGDAEHIKLRVRGAGKTVVPWTYPQPPPPSPR